LRHVNARAEPARPVIAVTGLSVEARIAAGPGVRAIASGGSVQALAAALEHALAEGARAVMSFGIAGGLAEELACGTWIIARAIVTPSARWPCDLAWQRRLAARLPGARLEDLAGVDLPVSEAADKRALHRATLAAAVDTESHVAAALAAAHGLPFVAFRVVADSARRMLPPAALVALAPDGRIRLRMVLGSLARSPSQLPLLLRTAIDARIALRALSRGRRLLGLGLGYPDRGEFLVDVS
jgi:adenosylhomocysteine nucleosidase